MINLSGTGFCINVHVTSKGWKVSMKGYLPSCVEINKYLDLSSDPHLNDYTHYLIS